MTRAMSLLLLVSVSALNAQAPVPEKAPAPRINPTTRAKVELGKQLFFDKRLSGDNSISCADCHPASKAFQDGLQLSRGAGGRKLRRNTPSLLNVAFQSSWMWDGRARTLEDQALLPIRSREEMNQDLGELEKELAAVAGYAEQFRLVFGEGVTRRGIARALAAFERTLTTPTSAFDRYLAGDEKALSGDARRGFAIFKAAGCTRCHKGPLLADGKFYRLGVSFTDPGRGAVTGKASQRYAFRTPTLRNVARTAPYMHDGSLATLEDVVTFYYRNAPTVAPDRKPLDIAPIDDRSYMEIPELVAFLKALDTDLPKITPPKLP